MSAVSTFQDDAKYRVSCFNEMSDYPRDIKAKPVEGRAIQITGLDQITHVISALRGQRESNFTVKSDTSPKGHFTVTVDSDYSGQAVLSFKMGDWLVMVGQEKQPRLISAEEFRQYWEVS